MVKARRSLVCDFIQQADSGKLNLLGVFDNFTVEDEPGTLASFFLYTALVADDPAEMPVGSRIEIEMVHKDGGEPLMRIEATSTEPPPKVREEMRLGVTVILQFGPLAFAKLGTHIIKIHVNGAVVDEIRVGVVKKVAP